MRGYPNWVGSKNSPSHTLYQFNSNIKNNGAVYTISPKSMRKGYVIAINTQPCLSKIKEEKYSIEFLSWTLMEEFVCYCRCSVTQSCLTAACQTSLSITVSWSLLKLMYFELVMPSSYLVLCLPLLLPSIFPSIRVFSNELALQSGSQSIGASASASVLPVNIQDCFPLGWTGWLSLLSKRLSRVFSCTTIQKHQFFDTQLSLWTSSHICTWLLEKP